MNYHNSVLLNESVNGLNIKSDGVYVDVTFGGGGHSREILKRLNGGGRIIAFDQDLDSVKNVIDDKRFFLITENFMNLKKLLIQNNINKVDGILADFGISSHQIDEPMRGFSIRYDAQLDMRMNQKSRLSAFDVVNNYSANQLANLFHEYGELRNSKLISRKIIEFRKIKQILTTSDLNEILIPLIPKKYKNKFLGLVYQAIRIEVNNELEAIKLFLIQANEMLNIGGRLSIISYHSLEDRLVKRFVRNGLFKGESEKDVFGNTTVPLKKIGKLITPSKEEILENNRARSAKLRIAEKIN